ncbi:hypothetical protein HYH03_007208 [Edaphochlamys debaryana]|uniref:Uncharacterized protein n=1 Tax=Edaphochlamys debaryana TaxID=47281 RepID=A0A835Y3U6_9CHLO|nr:hypothetical protein HYH03_007208 [Edaphochlamys debaryana]|eukprot:KAG2494692.1 hypothetical protein HYH03_007208 [Edaphochlamys debaryana]
MCEVGAATVADDINLAAASQLPPAALLEPFRPESCQASDGADFAQVTVCGVFEDFENGKALGPELSGRLAEWIAPPAPAERGAAQPRAPQSQAPAGPETASPPRTINAPAAASHAPASTGRSSPASAPGSTRPSAPEPSGAAPLSSAPQAAAARGPHLSSSTTCSSPAVTKNSERPLPYGTFTFFTLRLDPLPAAAGRTTPSAAAATPAAPAPALGSLGGGWPSIRTLASAAAAAHPAAASGVGYVVGPADDPLVPVFASTYLSQATPTESLPVETSAVLLSDSTWDDLKASTPAVEPKAVAVRSSLSKRLKSRTGGVTTVLMLPSTAADVSSLILDMAGVSVSCTLMDPLHNTPLNGNASWSNRVVISAASVNVPDATAVDYLSCNSNRAQALLSVTVGGTSRALAVGISVPGGGTLRLVSFNLLNVAPGMVAQMVTTGVDTGCSKPPPAAPPPSAPPPAEWAASSDCNGFCLLGAPLSALGSGALGNVSLADGLSDGPLLLERFAAAAFPSMAPVSSGVVPSSASVVFLSDDMLKKLLADPNAGSAVMRRVRRRPTSQATTVFLSGSLASASTAVLQLLTGNTDAACTLVNAETGELVGGGGLPSWAEGITLASGPDLTTLRGASAAGISEAISCAPGGSQLTATVVARLGRRTVPVVVETRPNTSGGLLRLIPRSLLLTHPEVVRSALAAGVDERPCQQRAPPPPVSMPPPSSPLQPPPPTPPPALPPPPSSANVLYSYGTCVSSILVPGGSPAVAKFLQDYFPETAQVGALPPQASAVLLPDAALQAIVEARDDAAQRALLEWTRGSGGAGGSGGRTITVLLTTQAASSVTLLSVLNGGTRLRCALVDPVTGVMLQGTSAFANNVNTEGSSTLDGAEGLPGIACVAPSSRAVLTAADTGAALVVESKLSSGATLRLASLALLERAPSDLAAAILHGTPGCNGVPPPSPAPSPPPGLLEYHGRPGCVSTVTASNEDASFQAFIDEALPDLPSLLSLGLDARALLLSTPGWDLLNRFTTRPALAALTTWAAQSSLTLAISESSTGLATALTKLSGTNTLKCGLVDVATGAEISPRMTWTAGNAVGVPTQFTGTVLPSQAGAQGISCAPGSSLNLTATVVVRPSGGGPQQRVPVVVEVALPAGGTLRLVPANSLAVPELRRALLGSIIEVLPAACQRALVGPSPPAPLGPVNSPPKPNAAPPQPTPAPTAGGTDDDCVSYSDGSGGGTTLILPDVAAAEDATMLALLAALASYPLAGNATGVDQLTDATRNALVVDTVLEALNARQARALAAMAASPGKAVTVVVGANATDESLAALLKRLGLGRASCSITAREPDGAPSSTNCKARPEIQPVNCSLDAEANVYVIEMPTGGRVRLVPLASIRPTQPNAGRIVTGYVPPSPPQAPPLLGVPAPPTAPAEPYPGWKADACQPVFGPCTQRPAKNRLPYILANGTTSRKSPVDGWHEVYFDIPPVTTIDNATELAYAFMVMADPRCEGSQVTSGLVTSDAPEAAVVAAHYHMYQAPASKRRPAVDCVALKVSRVNLSPEQARKSGNRLVMRFMPSTKCKTLEDVCGDYRSGSCVYAFADAKYAYCPVKNMAYTDGS